MKDQSLRFNTKKIKLSNQEIIELAYLTMEMIKQTYGQKLIADQANCYRSCFYLMRNLLKQVDKEYLDQHGIIDRFFQEGQELSNDKGRLDFKNSVPLKDLPF